MHKTTKILNVVETRVFELLKIVEEKEFQTVGGQAYAQGVKDTLRLVLVILHDTVDRFKPGV